MKETLRQFVKKQIGSFSPKKQMEGRYIGVLSVSVEDQRGDGVFHNYLDKKPKQGESRLGLNSARVSREKNLRNRRTKIVFVSSKLSREQTEP